jgi:hypothetical protein
MRMKRLVLTLVLLAALAGVARCGLTVAGGLSREHTARPGDKYEGTIQLKNEGETPYEVMVYQTDYAFLATGETFYGEPRSIPRSNAGWISFNPQWLSIPAMSTASLHYTVQVPEDPVLTGTYWSMIMLEPTTTLAQVLTTHDGEESIGLQTILRYGIQIVTDIGETAKHDIRFSRTQLIERDGARVLEIDLENVGETWMSPSISVELYDEGGTHSHHFDGQRLRVYPGCSVRHTIDLTGVLEGKYKALAIVDNSDDYVFGAQYDLWIE